MVVLKAIGRFFAKIGRWIRDTAWVQPLLIVGGIFAIIFSIPRIVSWVDNMNEESNAAQTFFENKIISAQGKEGKISEGSVLDNYLSILENKDNTYTTKEAAFSAVNDTLKLNGQKRFFVLFVDSTATSDSLYTGLSYLKDHWDNAEFKDLEGDFTYRTVYIDAVDKYDESKNLFEDAYSRHNFENLASDLYFTKFAENKNYDEGASDYYDILATSSSGFSCGTIMFFDYNSDAYAGVTTHGLRSCFTNSDVAGSSDYERAQNLANAWREAQYSVFGPDYVK
ncbi:MAG: hypothetical protein MJZ37_09705 [Bacilli bacterium]|nr:hypothetical protein [Bacilli bacterium]